KGQDLLIAGTTDFDGNAVALAAILGEWADPLKSLSDRVKNLTNGSGPSPTNGPYFLTTGAGGTVHDDSDADRLAGKQDGDWYFASTSRDVFSLDPLDVLSQL